MTVQLEDRETETRPVRMPESPVVEQQAFRLPGVLMAVLSLVLVLGGAGVLVPGLADEAAALIATGVVLGVVGLVLSGGLVAVAPGEARVLQFLGRYTGTVRPAGLHWVNPFSSKTKVSTRIRNHETAVMKVNDSDGNPIEIASVVVWQVADTAQATFAVDSFVEFVETQTETAVRHIATSYPYDGDGEQPFSLRDNADEITGKLSAEIAARVRAAGVDVVESRLTHLAYAPEIAQAMLQRQQAGAVVAARQRIVEGAVGMVDLALQRLSEREVVELDEERKAAMVSNLLVVLCGDTQPVVNTGSLYH
ncbi:MULTISPECIES: SPFH domain-containing protein [unclassified Saccharopolyspora]|uniref:SPFH domain-containing protein n=1 Tax=unclassified Saccharopolyspora TaxID=2646250 RepID=UPI001CD53691|nr:MULTISPECIES: SPFH domain-containing protein [unclassified Saccharopolyspora]MCA1188446.1 SPFH domain-containing protein [Saccharopolyspora sp. 6T]MCA1192772.1 SPFH domain-containing protein [Saccharopolyspora sp. 6V]MCA1225388.1 SPFH domain-containing protein [Saccharopolyspora sp. 6M]MCA1279464.1 SPFH domain-containing protein [Saccharopolyspora sp. 7B]